MWSGPSGVRYVHYGRFGCSSLTPYVDRVVDVSEVAAPNDSAATGRVAEP